MLNSKNILEKIYEWLKKMGVPPDSLSKTQDSVSVRFKTLASRDEITVYFFENGKTLTFEAPIFECVTGNAEEVSEFYQLLLYLNSNLPLLRFGIIQDTEEKFFIALMGSLPSDTITVDTLSNIFSMIENHYNEFTPKFKQIAKQNHLTFNGQQKNSLSNTIKKFMTSKRKE